MFSPRLLDHFSSPRHAGSLPAPAICSEVANPACGDILRLCVNVEDKKITDASFQARGCTASIAAGSALCEWLLNQPLADVQSASKTLLKKAIEDRLDPLPAESSHVVTLCWDACRALILRIR